MSNPNAARDLVTIDRIIGQIKDSFVQDAPEDVLEGATKQDHIAYMQKNGLPAYWEAIRIHQKRQDARTTKHILGARQ